MILEYLAHAAVADIRRLAAPTALGSAVLSRGVEDHAGFATQSARATTESLTPYRLVLACELIAAVRALRMAGVSPASALLGEAFTVAANLPADYSDRPLDADVAQAQDLLTDLANLLGVTLLYGLSELGRCGLADHMENIKIHPERSRPSPSGRRLLRPWPARSPTAPRLVLTSARTAIAASTPSPAGTRSPRSVSARPRVISPTTGKTLLAVTPMWPKRMWLPAPWLPLTMTP